MSPLKTFFPYFLIALLVGVSLSAIFGLGNSEIFFLSALAVVIIIVGVMYRQNIFFITALLFLCIALGIFRYISWSTTPRDTVLEERVGQSLVLQGVVIDEPDIREGSTRLVIAVGSIDEADSTVPAFGHVVISVARYPEYQYGDALLIKGKLQKPKKFSETDGRVFDYPMYLASKGIQYQIPFPVVERVDVDRGNSVTSTLYKIKHRFIDVLTRLFPEPHNALLGGLLLGGKQSLGSEWLEIFRNAGIIHIVVLSGYNMTIVSEWLVILFRFLGFYGSLSMGGIGIIFFAIMTGGGATVIRAAIMAIIALVARATGRTYTMGRALLIAGVCMVLQNPSILVYDPSFQLSFLAALGLIFVTPVIERHTKLFTEYPLWRDVFISTVSTQIMVLPLLLYQTGMLSLVALPVNMLVLPIIPLTMLSGFVAGTVASLIPFLGMLFALFPHFLLSWILFISKAATQIPYAAVSVPISASMLFILYGALVIFLFREHHLLGQEARAIIPTPPLPPSSLSSDKKETSQEMR